MASSIFLQFGGIATDVSGNATVTGKIASYNGVTTVGFGVPALVGYGRSTAQTGAVASVATYTVGAADGSFEVSANVLATTATTYSFNVTLAYTDESNVARSVVMNMMLLGAGNISNSAPLSNTNGPAYMSLPIHIRCKAATVITIATSGTFTTVTYNVEGLIKQTA